MVSPMTQHLANGERTAKLRQKPPFLSVQSRGAPNGRVIFIGAGSIKHVISWHLGDLYTVACPLSSVCRTSRELAKGVYVCVCYHPATAKGQKDILQLYVHLFPWVSSHSPSVLLTPSLLLCSLLEIQYYGFNIGRSTSLNQHHMEWPDHHT